MIAGGTPLDDAVAFGQWRAARRLVERGANTALVHAAAPAVASAPERGQREAAEYLLEQGADLNWVSVWDGLTPSTPLAERVPTSWSDGWKPGAQSRPASSHRHSVTRERVARLASS